MPNLDKAVAEVARVLKKDGKFYCTTNGKGGMTAFLRNAVHQIDPQSTAFTQEFSFHLQNGAAALGKCFSQVERKDYEDSLAVTVTEDLMRWIKSSASISGYSAALDEKLSAYFENIRKQEGVIRIPKECGLFISVK